MSECPECGYPLDGFAANMKRHVDCQARVDRDRAVWKLRRQILDLDAEGKSVSWIGAHLHIGNDTVRKLLKGGGAPEADRD